MRVVRNFIIFIIVLYIAFIAFMPKKEIYYSIENELSKQGVVIYNEKIKETPINLSVERGVVNYQGIDVARFNSLNFKPFIFINSLKLDRVELLDLAKKALNIEIDSLIAKESIFKPFIINIQAKGSFGDAKGYIDLKKRIIHIDITDAQDIQSLKKFLKKGEKGWYYESKF